MTDLQDEIDIAFNNVRDEVSRAMYKFPAYNSTHEGYAVILEELDEMWDDIKNNRTDLAIQEAMQVAATAIRFMVDIKMNGYTADQYVRNIVAKHKNRLMYDDATGEIRTEKESDNA